jgi:dihydrolipoamide dehydrogenase
MDRSPGYDAVVIGVGTAGGSVIWPLHEAGLKVAAVERELVGGLCAYWGCIPSKTLLRPGTIGWEARHGFGVGEPRLTWPEIAQYRNWMVRDWNDEKEVEHLQQEGVDFFRGSAAVAGPGQVQVDGRTLETKRIVVATGSMPSIPPIPGLDGVKYWTNREATSFQEVPKSVLVVGGGAIGCELGQALHSYGAKVTIVEEAKQLLGHENPGAAGHLEERFKRIGITFYLGRKTVKVEETSGGKTATLDNGQTISAEEILVSTGRKADTDGLGLEQIGVTITDAGIKVDEHCRAAENVWAVGDVTGVAGFTHVADYQGRIASEDILGRPRPANYSAIPAVTYTDPEVASVGITRQDAAPEGMELDCVEAPLSASSRTDTYGRGYEGGLSLFADRNDRVLVGAWAVGPLAGEWIQFATLAIRARVSVSTLDDTMLAFPTFTRLYLDPIHTLQEKLR